MLEDCEVPDYTSEETKRCREQKTCWICRDETRLISRSQPRRRTTLPLAPGAI